MAAAGATVPAASVAAPVAAAPVAAATPVAAAPAQAVAAAPAESVSTTNAYDVDDGTINAIVRSDASSNAELAAKFYDMSNPSAQAQ